MGILLEYIWSMVGYHGVMDLSTGNDQAICELETMPQLVQ